MTGMIPECTALTVLGTYQQYGTTEAGHGCWHSPTALNIAGRNSRMKKANFTNQNINTPAEVLLEAFHVDQKYLETGLINQCTE